MAKDKGQNLIINELIFSSTKGEKLFYFNYSCINKWIAIVMSLTKQLKLKVEKTSSISDKE